jgi:hypothetical protein
MSKPLTKLQAKMMLNLGCAIFHSTFIPGEFIRKVNGKLIDEAGLELEEDGFWRYRSQPIFDSSWFVFDEDLLKANQLKKTVSKIANSISLFGKLKQVSITTQDLTGFESHFELKDITLFELLSFLSGQSEATILITIQP